MKKGGRSDAGRPYILVAGAGIAFAATPLSCVGRQTASFRQKPGTTNFPLRVSPTA